LAAEQRHPWGLATLKRSIAAVRLAEGYEDAAAGELAQGGADSGGLGGGCGGGRTPLCMGRGRGRGQIQSERRQQRAEGRGAVAEWAHGVRWGGRAAGGGKRGRGGIKTARGGPAPPAAALPPASRGLPNWSRAAFRTRKSPRSCSSASTPSKRTSPTRTQSSG